MKTKIFIVKVNDRSAIKLYKKCKGSNKMIKSQLKDCTYQFHVNMEMQIGLFSYIFPAQLTTTISRSKLRHSDGEQSV